MGKYTSKINTLKEALKDRSGLSESQVTELEAGLKKFEEMEEAETKKGESKPAAKNKAPKKKKNKSHKKAAEPEKPKEKKKVVHKKVSEKRKKHIEKREAKKKNKSHKAEPAAKKKIVHKRASPKRAAVTAKREEHKAAKHHKPEHKPEAGKSVHHRIDAIIKDVEALKPEISRMAEHERKDAEEKMRARLRSATSEIFSEGGNVKDSGVFDIFEDILFMGSSNEKFGKGGSPKEGTKAAAEKKHPHVKLKKGYRLVHGSEAPKGDKNKNYSEGNNVKPDKGHFVRGGLETVEGAKKDKFYEDGGSPKKKGGNPNFKPSYGIFTDKAKAEAQAKAKNGIVETLKAKTVPAHTKKKKDKKTGEMREVHHKERHYPVRYMVKSK